MTTSRTTHASRGLTAGLIAALVLSACGASAPAATAAPATAVRASAAPATAAPATAAPATAAPATPAPAPKKVSFILDFLPGAVHLPFYAAVAKGYYKDVNLDVELVPGRGSTVAAQQVATGAATLGFADFSAMASGVAAGQPLKMVAGVLQRGSSGLGSLCDSNIKTAADLKGKRIAGPAGTTTFLLLSALLAKNNLKETDIIRVTVDSSAQTSTVLNGQAELRTTTLYDQKLQIEAAKLGKKACTLGFADAGIVTMGHGIIASNSLIGSDPDLIKRFVAASMKGLQFTVDSPDQARALMVPLAKDALEEELKLGWEFIPALLRTDRTKGNPLGFMAEADIDSTLTLLESTGVIKTRSAANQYFTNQFVSP